MVSSGVTRLNAIYSQLGIKSIVIKTAPRSVTFRSTVYLGALLTRILHQRQTNYRPR